MATRRQGAGPGRAGRDGKQRAQPEGELRQSQMVTTFGPGAMVDLVNQAVVIGGLEHWSAGSAGWVSLDDERLRASLLPRLRALDPDLTLATENYFRMAPEGDPREPFPSVGVRALEFPRWFVCQKCHRLARALDGFEKHSGRYRHECGGNKRGLAVPVRFVGACKRGHLSDFPWIAFAHSKTGKVCERPDLTLTEGATGDFGRIAVKCKTCGEGETMNRAAAVQYRCGGDRPWLGGRAADEVCEETLELLVRTASNAYFAQMVSALRLEAEQESDLMRRLRASDVWRSFERVKAPADLEVLIRMLPAVEGAVSGASVADAFAAIEAIRGESNAAEARPLRSVEFQRLTAAPDETQGVIPERGAKFAAYRIPRKKLDVPKGVAGLVLVPALREVRVQVSFSRIDSVGANLQGEYDYDTFRVKPATLTMPTGNEKWLPAAEVRGEGIFVELDEAAVRAWEHRPSVARRTEDLLRAFDADGPRGEFPGARFYLLHSLSHLLLTAISLECGYSASAIRERIYCAPENDPNGAMAALLLSTGTTGSGGTLGGLVEEGRRVRSHLREAWELGRLCSNDPVCAAHDPASESSDRRTEGAACHGCLYIAESSCERFNRYLDRALVVPTIGNDASLAFFMERP